MMTKEIALGLVGIGKWGKNYLNTVGSGLVPNVRIASVCARTPATLAGVDGQYLRTTDYRELASHRLDGVIIASPSDTHFEIAAYLLDRGQNILIEKPVTQTYRQAFELQRMHQQTPRAVVMVGHIQIYDLGYEALKSSLRKIGKIKEMVFRGLQSPPRTDSTTLENWGPHPVYLFEDLVGKRPTSLSARQKVNDNVHMDISYGPQIIGRVDIGSIFDHKQRELIVVGQDGTFTFDWSDPQKKSLVLTTARGNTDVPIPTNRSPLEVEIVEFVRCISEKTVPRTSLTQGVEVMRILEVAQESLNHNGEGISL